MKKERGRKSEGERERKKERGEREREREAEKNRERQREGWGGVVTEEKCNCPILMSEMFIFHSSLNRKKR